MTQEMTPMEEQSTAKRWIRRIWGALPLILFFILIWILGEAVTSRKEALEAAKLAEMRKDTPAINVITMPLKPIAIRDRINLPGTIEPWIELQVRAEVRGQVVSKKLDKGAHVKKGDVICRIDIRDYENELQAAKASYDAALSSKKRIKKLYAEELATQSQLDDVIAQVDSLKARMDIAKLNLERCTIRSQITGIVNQLYFEAGQYINVSDPVADVLQLDPVKVSIGIPESDVNAVRQVTDYQVRIEALGSSVFKGKKHFLSSAADPMARLYNLELVIENPDGKILPDMFARVEIVKKEVQDALVVPLYAVISLKERKLVYVNQNNEARSREVMLGLQEGWRVAVTEGLKAGDQVIVVGQRSVNDGQPVNVIRTVTELEELAR